MADYNIIHDSERFSIQFWRIIRQMRCALPGVIVSFNSKLQTATVQPALTMKVTLSDEISYTPLPPIENIPVVLPFAQSAGLLLTLPIQTGDECLLIFSDRALDDFVQNGGISNTTQPGAELTGNPRCHDLSDAICIPGIISTPQAVPSYNTEHIELRDRERNQYISLGPEGITITDGTAKWNMKKGKITLNAPAGIEETSTSPISRTTTATETLVGSNIRIGEKNSGGVDEIENTLRSKNGTFIDKYGVNLTTHRHTDVETGTGITGSPAV